VRKSVKHHERCKIVKYETLWGKILIVSDSTSLVRYDLNITLRCFRFYDLAPLLVLDPIYVYLCTVESIS